MSEKSKLTLVVVFNCLLLATMTYFIREPKPAAPEAIVMIAENNGLFILERPSPAGSSWIVSIRPVAVEDEARLRMGDLNHPNWKGFAHIAPYSSLYLNEIDGVSTIRIGNAIIRGDESLVRRLAKESVSWQNP